MIKKYKKLILSKKNNTSLINEMTRVFEIKSEPAFHQKKNSTPNYFLIFLNCFNVLMLKINLKNLDEFNPIIKKRKRKKKVNTAPWLDCAIF
jgi:hypothetical protein